MEERKPRILLVDDENFYLDVLVELLRGDHQVIVAKNAAQALKRALANPAPDLILLDVLLPDMDGYGICRQLKENPRTAGIPVIFLTVMNEVEDEIKGFHLGAVDYITKPISPLSC
jgi:putative two-component system response regulator